MNTENDISSDQLELIENYLMLKLTANQRAEFEDRLKQDSELQNKLEELGGVFNGIKQAARFQKVEEWHAKILHNPKHSTPGRIVNYKVWMVAATILTFCASIWLIFFSKNKEEQLFAKYYKPDFGMVTAMSATDNFAFDKAMIDYKSGNYRMAINTWQQMLVQRPGSDTLHYFIGASYLALHNYKQASASFKKVLALKQSPFVQDAYWYLGLSALQLGNSKDASIYISKSDHQKKQALLNELKR